MFYLGLILSSLLYTGYIYIQYKYTNSNLFAYYAIFYGVVSHAIWALSVKNLNNKDVFINGFIWDFVLTILLVFLPFFISDSLTLSKMQYIGLTLMVVGSILLKL